MRFALQQYHCLSLLVTFFTLCSLISYKLADGKDDSKRLKINDVSFKPNPLKKGEKVTISVDFKLCEYISSIQWVLIIIIIVPFQWKK